MWKCEKCGRAFKNENHSHYCGEKPRSIEAYIMEQDAAKQPDLFYLHQPARDRNQDWRNCSKSGERNKNAMMSDDEFKEAALSAGVAAAEVEKIIMEQRKDAKRGGVLLTFEELLPALGEP